MKYLLKNAQTRHIDDLYILEIPDEEEELRLTKTGPDTYQDPCGHTLTERELYAHSYGTSILTLYEKLITVDWTRPVTVMADGFKGGADAVQGYECMVMNTPCYLGYVYDDLDDSWSWWVFSVPETEGGTSEWLARAIRMDPEHVAKEADVLETIVPGVAYNNPTVAYNPVPELNVDVTVGVFTADTFQDITYDDAIQLLEVYEEYTQTERSFQISDEKYEEYRDWFQDGGARLFNGLCISTFDGHGKLIKYRNGARRLYLPKNTAHVIVSMMEGHPK